MIYGEPLAIDGLRETKFTVVAARRAQIKFVALSCARRSGMRVRVGVRKLETSAGEGMLQARGAGERI